MLLIQLLRSRDRPTLVYIRVQRQPGLHRDPVSKMNELNKIF